MQKMTNYQPPPQSPKSLETAWKRAVDESFEIPTTRHPLEGELEFLERLPPPTTSLPARLQSNLCSHLVFIRR